MEDNQQELMFKLSMFEQKIKNLQEQLQTVERAMLEISNLGSSLDEIKSGKEILSSVGKGIFAKAKLVSDDLVVDIGENNFVKKSIKETKDLMDEQVEKLKDVKNTLERNLEEVNQKLTKTFMESQKE